ncbi:hypothetical protein [Streptomyces sp. WAC 06738]|uniref:hypothetical protein n=1 Tax=Streptomyces sp. WAC 06738 TaxID=2203210 RepID=UPI0013E0DEDB|nr:hypothetical protein [Streptomyces sp. WAC 06738]
MAWALSKTARRVLRSGAAHILHLDVEEIFTTGRDAAQDLRKELGAAREVVIWTSRGMDLQREPFGDLLRRCESGQCRCRILLPQMDVPAGRTDWLNDREQELRAFDSAFGTGLLRRQVAATYDYLSPYVTNGHLEVRGYNFPHVGRIVLTERVVYLTPYRADRHGWDTPVIKYRRGEQYSLFARLLTKLWNEGEAP